MTTTNNDGEYRADANEAEDVQGQGARFSRRLGESAEQIWLAGLGALGRAQSEGTRVFESLVKEGAAYQREGRRQAEAGADALRDQVGTRFEQARGKASENWQKLGKAFDERVKSALHSLQLPDRDEIEALRAEVVALKSKLQSAEDSARAGSPEERVPASAVNDAKNSAAPAGSE